MRKLFGRCLPSLALALSLASVAAMAEDQDPRLPSLGDLMVITQLRQFKLWYSAQAANWKLAEYQDEQLEKTLSRIAALYPETQKINQSQILRERVAPALGDLRRAVASKDKAGFEKSLRAGHGRLQRVPSPDGGRLHRRADAEAIPVQQSGIRAHALTPWRPRQRPFIAS